MTFVDQVSVRIRSGSGGAGLASFRREKFVPKGGPDGGDGGNGGHVIFEVNSQLQTLMDLALAREFSAQNGRPGEGKKCHGPRGKDKVISVPSGTMIYDEDGTLLCDLTEEGERFVAAKGGKGGKGNPHFSNSSNRTPRYAQPGLEGEEKTLRLELKLIAEIGLLGLPNAGKSTLLKCLTQANPKIGDYPFTTLHPNLGVLKSVDREIVIADIPGIIDGASEGHGLGDAFLRHLERTHTLLHLLDVVSSDAEQVWADYRCIRDELQRSDYDLRSKPELVLLTKVDLCSAETLDCIQARFSDAGIETLTVSSHSRHGIDALIARLLQG